MVMQEQEDHDRQDEPCRVDAWKLQAATGLRDERERVNSTIQVEKT